MTSATLAAASAALLGPLTILLSGRLTRTPWRPTLVESTATAAAAGIAVALVTDRLPLTALPLVVLGPAAAVVDAREGRLPDALTGPLLGCTLLAALASGDAPRLLITACSAVVIGVVLAVVARNLIGWGDAKLLPTLAVVLADRGALVTGLVLSTVLIALTAAALAVRDRHADVPYGPALVIGALAAAGGA